MKKILFSLVALVASMNMNAQVMKVMKGNDVVETYTGTDYSVVFEEAAALGKTGTAKRTGNIDVKWVQLWEDGPRFAEYNVGAANNKAEDYGGYYSWGKTIDKDSNKAYKEGTDALTGTDDTATNLWGSAWRMPTKAEIEALLANCDVAWTTNYKESGVKGIIFTGKDGYASNSVFLPAAGQFGGSNVLRAGIMGFYWSSTPGGSEYAECLYVRSGPSMYLDYRYCGCSVRAVLAE